MVTLVRLVQFPKAELQIYFIVLGREITRNFEQPLKADEAIIFVPSRTATKADELSKGNQQKVQLMAALISDQEFLILDEPLSGLDPINTELFKDVIKEQINAKKYIILSSHQMSTVEEFCTNLTLLDKGKTVLQGNLDDIKKEYGRVNLMLKTEENIDEIIGNYNLKINNKVGNEYSIRLANALDGKSILSDLIGASKTIVKYELREPSLHEIFIDKVGKESNEEK
jgi:ABC-2 type transport system ATP-binding protein